MKLFIFRHYLIILYAFTKAALFTSNINIKLTCSFSELTFTL